MTMSPKSTTDASVSGRPVTRSVSLLDPVSGRGESSTARRPLPILRETTERSDNFGTEEDDEESDVTGEEEFKKTLAEQDKKIAQKRKRIEKGIAMFKARKNEEAVRGRIEALEERERAIRALDEEWEEFLGDIANEGIPNKRARRGETEEADSTRTETREPESNNRRESELGTTIRAIPDLIKTSLQSKTKMADLPRLKGKSISEARTFFKAAERRFRQCPTDFPTDTSKIDYCVNSFERKPLGRWDIEETVRGTGNTTWGEFVDFIKDTIVSKEARKVEAEAAYHAAVPRENQPIDDFVSYLAELEVEIGISDPGSLYRKLFHSLSEEMQKEIWKFSQPMPTTREELVNIVRRNEGANKLGKQSRPSTKSYEEKRDDQRSYKESKRDDRRTYEKSEVKKQEETRPSWAGRLSFSEANRTPIGREKPLTRNCFACGKEGHIITYCPDRTCYKCNKKGHMSTVCPENKLTGKGVTQS